MRIVLLVLLFACHMTLFAADGLISVQSQHDVKTTTDKMEAAVKAKGMKVFIRIDHAAGASSVGAKLRPTELLIFGNPKLGSALMGCAQTTAIDLPMKALVYENEKGEVTLSYNDPAYLKSRHQMPGCDKPIGKATKALAAFAKAATQ
jgi:uncharacterized protein (DUF302 family)